MGWGAMRTHLRKDRQAGNFWLGIVGLSWEAMVNDCGVTMAISQGQSRGPNPSTEQQ
jgi:hypothetical protein